MTMTNEELNEMMDEIEIMNSMKEVEENKFDIDIKILNSLLRDNEIESLNIFLNENGKLKEDINEKQINTIVKTLLLDMENNNNYNHFKIYDILGLKSLDNDVIKYMLQNKSIIEKNGVYVILHNSCNDQQKIDYVLNGNENKNYDFIIKKIKDVEFLKSIVNSDRLDYLDGIIENPNKTNEITNLLVDNLLKLGDDGSNYKYINSLKNLIESSNVDFSNFEKIMNRDDINSYFSVQIAKNENITNEIVEKIMNIDDKDKGSNVMFARTELILNPNVDEKYKIEIIENKEKYPYYNSNTDNAVAMYLNVINREFN